MAIYKESPYRLAAGDIAPPPRQPATVLAPSSLSLEVGGSRSLEPRSLQVSAIEATQVKVGQAVTLDVTVKPEGSAPGEVVTVSQEHVQSASSSLKPTQEPQLDPTANLTILTEEDLAALQANQESANRFAQEAIAAQTAAANERAELYAAEQQAVIESWAPQAIDYAPPSQGSQASQGQSVPIAPVSYQANSAPVYQVTSAPSAPSAPIAPQVVEVRYIDYYDDETGTMQSITETVYSDGTISGERT
ncbi:MAG: hypothetical protein AB7E70_20390 [Hyphomicrobiaceae bacterium]